LGGLTFRALVLRAQLTVALPEIALIETFPTAALRALGIVATSNGQRTKKATPDARAWAQRGLSRWVADIPAPEPEPWGTDLLDALAAALVAVAWIFRATFAAGDPAEGQIILPDAPRLARALGISPEDVQLLSSR
jgi:hypothetical protein